MTPSGITTSGMTRRETANSLIATPERLGQVHAVCTLLQRLASRSNIGIRSNQLPGALALEPQSQRVQRRIRTDESIRLATRSERSPEPAKRPPLSDRSIARVEPQNGQQPDQRVILLDSGINTSPCR